MVDKTGSTPASENAVTTGLENKREGARINRKRQDTTLNHIPPVQKR